MKELKNKGIIFANTLWFIHNFKMPLIEQLTTKNFDIEIIYLRLGPPINIKNKKLTKDIKIFNFYEYLLLSLKRYLLKKKNKKKFFIQFYGRSYNIIFNPNFYKSEKFYLWRDLVGFSSRKIFYRFLKIF